MKDEEQACRICCSADLKCIEAFGSMPRVTSDCVPFKRGGKLAVCVRCGAAQAFADEQWFAEIAEIYGKATAGVIKDTVVVPTYGRASVDFTADQPGPALFHCHIQQHMDYGFKALLRYS